jgi:hypothetical protein
MKGDSKKQLRSNHQKGHVNKDGVYIKHTEIKGKKKVKQNLRGDKPPRRTDMNNPGRTRLSKPIDFGMGSLPFKTGAPKLAPNFAPTGFPRGPPPIGGLVPNLTLPFQQNRPQGSTFNPPPQPFPNMPPPPPLGFNKSPTYIPPGAPSITGAPLAPTGLLGPKIMPPQAGQYQPPQAGQYQYPQFKPSIISTQAPQPPAKE